MIISSTACEIQQSCLCYCFHEFYLVRHGTLQFECLKLFFANFFFFVKSLLDFVSCTYLLRRVLQQPFFCKQWRPQLSNRSEWKPGECYQTLSTNMALKAAIVITIGVWKSNPLKTMEKLTFQSLQIITIMMSNVWKVRLFDKHFLKSTWKCFVKLI